MNLWKRPISNGIAKKLGKNSSAIRHFRTIGILEVIMAFDFKKKFKEFYMPKNKPEIVNVPKANYIAS